MPFDVRDSICIRGGTVMEDRMGYGSRYLYVIDGATVIRKGEPVFQTYLSDAAWLSSRLASSLEELLPRHDLSMNKPILRIPTDEEWDRLIDLTNGDNSRMHWWKMQSWVDGNDARYHIERGFRATRGGSTRRANRWSFYTADYRNNYTGFRPVIQYKTLGTLSREGETITVGTLYMDNKPVRIPKNPIRDGDVVNYIPGATLELREMLQDADYQVSAIYLGNGVFVADRNLLTMISYDDIEHGLSVYPRTMALHNSIIEQAEDIQKGLTTLQSQAESFYNFMRYEDTGLAEPEYDALWPLLRSMEDNELFSAMEQGLNALKGVAATGKVAIKQ